MYCGLANIGNTCYMNATLQCLNELNYIKEEEPDSELLKCFYKLMDEMKTTKNSAIVPKEFKTELSKQFPRFKGSNQQDSHEFLIEIIDYFNTETKKKKGKNFFTKFYGRYYSELNCPNCKFVSKTKTSFNIISVPVLEEFIDCFDEYINYERLDKGNEWNCDSCKNLVKAYKDTDFEKLPEILIIHFKRFNSQLQKITKNVNFTKFIKYGKKNFEIFAIIYHSGSYNSGHYYSVVNKNGIWYNFNDSFVSRVDLIQKENAYMLFYKLSTNVPTRVIN